MISIFEKRLPGPAHVLTIPTYCVPTEESQCLDAKRQAQLEWMRSNGMRYLGDPLLVAEKKEQQPLSTVRMRLVNVRNRASAYTPRATDR